MPVRLGPRVLAVTSRHRGLFERLFRRDTETSTRDARATQSKACAPATPPFVAKSFQNLSLRIRGTFLRAPRRSQIWRDKFAVTPFQTADAGPMHLAAPESSAYRSQPKNAPSAPIHHKKFRRDRTAAVLTGPMSPAELLPRPRLPPNAAWKCSRVHADNWHGPISKCIGRSLHSANRESHRHRIDEGRDGRSRGQEHYRKIFALGCEE